MAVDFDAFFAATYPSVVRALAYALGDRGAAEDAAQDAFAKAYRRWATVSEADRPAAWVYVVAVRDARRRLARVERIEQRMVDVDAVARLGGGRDPADGLADEADFLVALRSLPARQRLAVVLRYWGDLDEASMAQAMGCARGTVKATLSAALAKLRVFVMEEATHAH
jgi:RNA polymerase sigma factor (sigma-70 family)